VAAWACPSSPPPYRRRHRRRWMCLHHLRQGLRPPQLLPPPRPLPRQLQLLLQQLPQGPRQVCSPQWWLWQRGRRRHLPAAPLPAALPHRRRPPASPRAGVPAALALLSPLWYVTQGCGQSLQHKWKWTPQAALCWSAFAFSPAVRPDSFMAGGVSTNCVQARPLQQRASGWRLPNRPCHTQFLLFALPERPLLNTDGFAKPYGSLESSNWLCGYASIACAAPTMAGHDKGCLAIYWNRPREASRRTAQMQWSCWSHAATPRLPPRWPLLLAAVAFSLLPSPCC
jgi:hypothetical protein